MPPRRAPHDLLPLKPFVFQLLVILAGGDRHGWGLLREIEQRSGARVLPGQLYRHLEAMLADGLVDEHDQPRGAVREAREEGTGGAPPRRFFRLTPFGRRVADAEAQRLDGLVGELRSRDGGPALQPRPRRT